MNFKGIYYSLTFRLALAIGLTAALTYLALAEEWGWFLFLGVGWLATLRGISLLFIGDNAAVDRDQLKQGG